MAKHRLCLHDFDHAHATLERLQQKLHDACHGEGVSVQDCLLFRALGALDASMLALRESRGIAEDVL